MRKEKEKGTTVLLSFISTTLHSSYLKVGQCLSTPTICFIYVKPLAALTDFS